MKTFFLPPEDWGETYTLSHTEAHHIRTVLRMRAGARVRLFDGQGREGIFTITALQKQAVHLCPEKIFHHPAPVSEAYLAIGWTKSKRRGWLLEKAVELQAAGIWFWQAVRSQSLLPEKPKESWQAPLIVGAKQCGNPWLPMLRLFPGGVNSLLEASADFDQRFVVWEGQDKAVLLPPHTAARQGKTLFIIGPEGGLSDREAGDFIQGGFSPVSLGHSILRWETAALLCLGTHFLYKQLLSESIGDIDTTASA